MNMIYHQQTDRESQWLQASREELVERITQAIPEDRVIGIVFEREGKFVAS